MDERLNAPSLQTTPTETRLSAQVWPLLTSMRPRQWAKNLLVYLAFFFTAGEHRGAGLGHEFHLFGDATMAFALFCLLTGATYIVNDLLDLKTDRLHPTKRARPLASGALDTHLAARVAIACRWAGVLPQQPPMTEAPAPRIVRAAAAMVSGSER